MSIFSGIKKLFFASSSVAKSAASKATDTITDAGAELSNKTKDALSEASEQISNKTAGLRESVLEKADELWEQSKDLSADVVESVKNNEITKSVSDKIQDLKEDLSENELVKKAASMTENLGSEVIEKGGALLSSAGDVAENLGEKALDFKDKFVERAEDLKESVGAKVNEMVAEEKIAEAKDASKIEGGFHKETLNTGESLLKDTDDFFSRASKYADGEYDSFNEGKMDITQGPVEPKSPSKAGGFEDLDGDGNELIDDAEIIL